VCDAVGVPLGLLLIGLVLYGVSYAVYGVLIGLAQHPNVAVIIFLAFWTACGVLLFKFYDRRGRS
jgi:hypothetical protein